MSARDDYPLGRVDLGSVGVFYTVEPGLWHDLCDQIDELSDHVRDLEQGMAELSCRHRLLTAAIVNEPELPVGVGASRRKLHGEIFARLRSLVGAS